MATQKKRGRLALQDKYTIKGMLSEGKTVEEMADVVGRSEKSIEKYINSELESLTSTIAKVQLAQAIQNNADAQDDVVEDIVVESAEDKISRKTKRESAKKIFTQKTDSGQSVAVSTNATSARGDALRERMKKKPVSRVTSGNIWDIDKEEIVN